MIEIDEWITTKTGSHVLVGENGEIKAGMGGKFNGQTLKDISRASAKSFGDYKKQFGGDHYAAAKEFYRKELMGKPAKAMMGELGEKEVHFTGANLHKIQQNMNHDLVKAEAIEHLRSAVEDGKYLGSTNSYKDDDKFISYHHFQKEIPMKDENGNLRKLVVDVGRRKDGEFEYMAHSFIHSGEKRYGDKIGRLKDAGLPAEDQTIKKVVNPSLSGVFITTSENPPLGIILHSGHRLPTSKENISPSCPAVNPDCLTFDAASQRSKDTNGYLRVASSHITKEGVCPYYGREIPGYVGLHLDPDKIYYGYRPGDELAKAAATFNGLPLLFDHHVESAANPQKDFRVGSLGTDATWAAPYLDNSLIFTDQTAIDAVEREEYRELSAALKIIVEVVRQGYFSGSI